jgi:hypothetical protein
MKRAAPASRPLPSTSPSRWPIRARRWPRSISIRASARCIRYFENRAETERRRGVALPSARFACSMAPRWKSSTRCCRIGRWVWTSSCSTRPGRDDPFARHVATAADTLVTPLNDSFVDFDLIGQVDAETFKVRRLSFYAETDLGSAQEAGDGDHPRAAPRNGLGGGPQPRPAQSRPATCAARSGADRTFASESASALPMACPNA